MKKQTIETPKQVVEQVVAQYKTLGKGYDKHDPELQVAIQRLGEVAKFLSTRCVGDQQTISLMHNIREISEELELFRKMFKGGKVYTNEYHPFGLFEKGYDYSWRELRAIEEYPLSFKAQYGY
tara:strand:+ start:50 stop:418 length:369 start_codon:yes stop_codon:yes gene_type:complete